MTHFQATVAPAARRAQRRAAQALRVLLAAWPLLWPAVPVQAATQVGPATYVASSMIDEKPGSRPQRVYIATISQWKGQGASQAVSGGIDYYRWQQLPSSDVQARSSATELGVTAVASGVTQYEPSGTPYLHTLAVASTTVFWLAGAAAEAHPLGPLLLHGELGGLMQYAELPGPIFSRVGLRAEKVDLGGTVLQTLFAAEARVDWLGYGPGFRFSSWSSGQLLAADWAHGFTNTTPPYTYGFQMDIDIALLNTVTPGFSLQAGELAGLRWVLEAESRVTGTAVAAAMRADLGHTLEGIALQLPADTQWVQVDTVPPPVPEPAAALLLAGGLLLLRGWRWQQAGRRAEG